MDVHPFPVVHVVLETVAFSIGGLLYWRTSNAAARPIDRPIHLGILAGAIFGAAVGARSVYMLQYASALRGQPVAVWLGGKTIVGGLLGALCGVESAKRLLRWNTSTGDGFVMPLLVALVIGRIGCQLSGIDDLTYGTVTTLPWAWDYGDGVKRHPTALYEIVGLGGLAVVLSYGRFFKRSGDRFRVFMVGYLTLRLGLDYLKPPFGPAAPGTLTPQLWGPLSAIQWACVAGLGYYATDVHRWTVRGTRHA